MVGVVVGVVVVGVVVVGGAVVTSAKEHRYSLLVVNNDK